MLTEFACLLLQMLFVQCLMVVTGWVCGGCSFYLFHSESFFFLLSTKKYWWPMVYNLQLTYYRRRMQGTSKYQILDGRFLSWWWGEVNFLFSCITKAARWAFIIQTLDLAQIYIHRISRHYFGYCSRSPQSCRSVSFGGTQAALWVFNSTGKLSLCLSLSLSVSLHAWI